MTRLRTYNTRGYQYYGWNANKEEAERERPYLLKAHKSVLVLSSRRKSGGAEIWVSLEKVNG